MDHTNIADIADQLAEDNETETELMREVSFSLQVMRFEPGDEDAMHAHAEEEIYAVQTGEATLVTDDGSIEVGPGDIVHLSSGMDHRFTDFDGEFVTAVMYAPAEGSQAV